MCCLTSRADNIFQLSELPELNLACSYNLIVMVRQPTSFIQSYEAYALSLANHYFSPHLSRQCLTCFWPFFVCATSDREEHVTLLCNVSVVDRVSFQ